MKKGNKIKLEKLRHSAAHLLAAAVTQLWPEAKPTIGPAIENGFYYDFDFGEVKISEDDLPKIEKKMRKIVKDWKNFKRQEFSKKQALDFYKDNEYKKELIKELEKENQKITFYKSGDFVDLCKGGHVQLPNKTIKYFKLLSLAGAYWRGDENNKMLTRIYGTAFFDRQDLDKYLQERKEAEESNHRKLGQKLELFALFPETIGPGLPVWLPKGYRMRRILENYMLRLERSYGYEHVLTPHISRDKLFQISGHLNFYKDSMYSAMEVDGQDYFLKPMNCPAAMLIFNHKIRSYNDLPLKLGELGTVYRYERSGELHGLQRVRGFTQNDAHLFCTKEQLVPLIEETLEMMQVFYKSVGFFDFKYVLATGDRDKKKFQAAGTDAGWQKAENTLRKVLKSKNLDFEEKKGDAAFYGPKIDVLAVNVFGKADAISTIQIDFNLPERFKVSFVDKDGQKKEPFVIHRALIGSFERFFAFLIEHHKGAFPVWFSPVQVKILPISDKNLEYAQKITQYLIHENIRVEISEESDTLGNKIRKSQEEKVPYMIIIGDKEQKSNLISIRTRDGENRSNLELNRFIKEIKTRIKNKSLQL